MLMHQNLPFFMKNCPKMAAFWSKIEFFGFRQAFEDPPPYFEGPGLEETGCRSTQITENPIYRIRMHQNLPFFMK